MGITLERAPERPSMTTAHRRTIQRRIAAWITVLGLLAAFLVSVTTAMGGGSAGGYILSAVYFAIGLAGLAWWSILRRLKD
jgi:threonine/homoserine/homoserine lactone efflux protein